MVVQESAETLQTYNCDSIVNLTVLFIVCHVFSPV